jgi:hypothetical protein
MNQKMRMNRYGPKLLAALENMMDLGAARRHRPSGEDSKTPCEEAKGDGPKFSIGLTKQSASDTVWEDRQQRMNPQSTP